MPPFRIKDSMYGNTMFVIYGKRKENKQMNKGGFHMQSKEIMCDEDFEKCFNVRLAKCCASCKYGDLEYEGEATCEHPKRPSGLGYFAYSVLQCQVCNLWESKETRETKGEEVGNKIEFISYDGKYPNLCRGKLVVKIDDKKISFGKTTRLYSNDKPADYPRFWCSGGTIRYKMDSDDSYATQSKWEFIGNESDYPPNIWKLLPDILEIMNENVEYGCCGGCE
jgi:hypothetical protein